MNKIRMNVYLTPAQMAGLRKRAEKTGAPVAELIRRAVEAYLRKL
jgi:hypothetical protein